MKTFCLLCIGISTLLIAGCSTTPTTPPRDSRASKPPARASAPALQLLVISAVYGSGTKFADVTYRVDDLLRQPGVEFFARPEWLQADPNPGWNKDLVIVFDYKGQRRMFATGEGGKVSVERLLSPPSQAKKAKKPARKK